MAFSTPNLLIVEGDSGQTELAMDLIREVVRAQIDSTNSGERAIELVSRTPYQLVIADCSTGEVDGLALLERVKRVSPQTSVILTSSFASIEEAVKAVRSGADEYFKKPYNPETFKLAVQRCLDRRMLYTGDRTVSGLMLLLNACQLVSGCLEEEKILEAVTGYLKRETAAKGVALFRCQGEKRARIPTTSDIDSDVVEVLVEGHHFLESAREERLPTKVIPKTNSTPEVAVFSFSCSPEAQYFVVCIAPTWIATPEEVDSRFRLLQAQIQMTGRNIINYRGVRNLLYLDEPTGLYNTRFMHRSLDQLFQRRDGGEKVQFSVMFIDVDKFKSINDRYGHLIGTKLLFEMGQIIRKCIRKNDLAFRYGGDEFVILMEGVNATVAGATAEKLRLMVEATKFLSREALNVKLTISVGIASCPEHATSKKDIIEAADNAMYNVKRTTRNKVYIADKKVA